MNPDSDSANPISILAVSYAATHLVRAISSLTRSGQLSLKTGSIGFVGEVTTPFGAALIEDQVDRHLAQWVAEATSRSEPLLIVGSGYKIELKFVATCAKNAEGWVAERLGTPPTKSNGGATGGAGTLSDLEELDTAWKKWSATLPVAYQDRIRAMTGAQMHLRNQMAADLEPLLNAEIAKRPQASYQDKKDTAKWINAQVRSMGGMAIKCPKDGSPSYLIGHVGNGDGAGRFIWVVAEGGGRTRRAMSAIKLPYVQLVAAPIEQAFIEKVPSSRVGP